MTSRILEIMTRLKGPRTIHGNSQAAAGQEYTSHNIPGRSSGTRGRMDVSQILSFSSRRPRKTMCLPLDFRDIRTLGPPTRTLCLSKPFGSWQVATPCLRDSLVFRQNTNKRSSNRLRLFGHKLMDFMEVILRFLHYPEQANILQVHFRAQTNENVSL